MAPDTHSSELEKRLGDVVLELQQKNAEFQREIRLETLAISNKSDARFDEMMQMLTAISLQNQANATNTGGGEDSNVHGVRNNWGKSTRLEFPKFDGDGFDGWLMRVDYFFEVAEVPIAEKVRVAALHLEGKALQWHKGFVSLHGDKGYEDWAGYIRALAGRFGSQAYEDPLADLRNLKQVGTLQSYMDMFDELYPRTGIREDQALSFFLSGLVDELQMPIRMFKPKSLADAYALAKLQELTVKAIHNKPKGTLVSSSQSGGYNSYAKPLSVTTSSFKPSPTVVTNGITPKPNIAAMGAKQGPRVTSKQMDERRAKGLCFWCDEKYSPGHHCPKRRVYVMHMLEEENEDMLEEFPRCDSENTASELHLSLNAMWGLEGTQIMRIKGESQKKQLRILVDTGSTHNFLCA